MKNHILGIILSFCSCQNDVVPVPMEQEVLGEWNWIETTYEFKGSEPNILTPQNTDTVMVIRIATDKLEIIKNDQNFGNFVYSLKEVGSRTIINIGYENFTGLKMEEGPIIFENEFMHIAGGYDDTGGYQILERIK